ncbi:MAG: ATP-dependent DNA helicase RecG [Planctomycetes bacterium]|nr:ATP-dependent DNA helicase RecG [Planctomycetota bacterium]
MSTVSTLQLTTAVERIPGVGSRRAGALRRLGLRCVADLLRHLPQRYERELGERTVEEAATQGADAILTIAGEVETIRMSRGRKARFEATVRDETGTTLLTWFNAPWLRGKLHPGQRIRATGKMKRYGEWLQMVNPRWEVIEEDPVEVADGDAPRDGRLRPIYPASEDVSSAVIELAVGAILEPALRLVDDHLTDAYRAERELPPLADAYRKIHRPADEAEAAGARRRLAFDELLMLQLGVMLKRAHRRETQRAPALVANASIDEHIAGRLPFTLTASQREVIDEIAGDLTTPVPMNRLLQGDVGAGKTAVALYAMLLAVASEHQAALMAPTELLAEQHFATIDGMLAGSSVRLGLLTGSMRAAQRRELLERLETGEIDILMGTHALLTETVRFRRLALVVVDEQHRFGVHQRATLRAKGGGEETQTVEIPHTLVMTATPIPRTLSLTVFGDLDVSTIRHLPPGRRPAVTRHLSEAQAVRAYEFARSRIARGEQAFIVVPVIDESETGLKDITTHLKHLETGPFAGCRLAALHGRLDRDERDEIMGRFRDGQLDALVATTVIEVGVDVPRATVMIIEHADRFGLAQLHQLRGRIGRGARRGVCVLVADPTTEDAEARIAAIAGTTDGFEIAERDLEIRGPGELFGAKQSGMAPFFAARLPRDTELLRLARRDAIEWVARSPRLSDEPDALLRKRLLKAHGQWLGLGDVG